MIEIDACGEREREREREKEDMRRCKSKDEMEDNVRCDPRGVLTFLKGRRMYYRGAK